MNSNSTPALGRAHVDVDDPSSNSIDHGARVLAAGMAMARSGADLEFNFSFEPIDIDIASFNSNSDFISCI